VYVFKNLIFRSISIKTFVNIDKLYW